jgi:hypothetical protein
VCEASYSGLLCAWCEVLILRQTLFGTLGGTVKLIKMLEIQAVLDVTLNELSSKYQLILKEVVEQFQQKCLVFFQE